MIELVVFDMAGTTVFDGDAVGRTFRDALAAVGIAPTPASVNAVMGLPKPEAIRRLFIESGQTPTDAAIDAIHRDFAGRMIDYYRTDPAVCEMPGASATFAALKGAGIKIALNTGFSRAIVDVLLTRLAWHIPAVIDAVVTSDEVPRGRPFPDMIRHLMQLLKVDDAGRVAKVGDTAVDLEEGAAAGCGLNVGVTSGSYTRQQLEALPHTHVLSSVADLPKIILH